MAAGVMSMSRVRGIGAPWDWAASAPDHDVVDAVPVERGDYGRGVEVDRSGHGSGACPWDRFARVALEGIPAFLLLMWPPSLEGLENLVVVACRPAPGSNGGRNPQPIRFASM